MGDGMFEIRAKAKEGIGRGLFCYMEGESIKVLHAFVKKSQKTPKKDLDLAREYDALKEEFQLIDKLLSMREAAGLTQEELAIRSHQVQSTFRSLEVIERPPPILFI